MMNNQKFSLSFSKRIEKKALQPSALRHEGRGEVKEVPQALFAIDKDSLKNFAVEEEEKNELVIPLLQAKRSAVLSRLAKLQQEGGIEGGGSQREEGDRGKEGQEEPGETKVMTLDEKAEVALLEETKKKLDDWQERDIKNRNLTIPAAAQPEDPLAAPLVDIGKESTLDDYDQVDVGSFGAAVLRGMGWKKSEGVGGIKKRVVEIIDPSSRTLGSSEKKEEDGGKRKEESDSEEELPLTKGSYVFLQGGRHRGTYGVVEIVDEDHVLVRAAVSHALVREVEANLRVTTLQEYKESSRIINKDMYDKFKEAEARKKNEGRRTQSDTKKRTRQNKSSDDDAGTAASQGSRNTDERMEKDATQSRREEGGSHKIAASHRETNLGNSENNGLENSNRVKPEKEEERHRKHEEKDERNKTHKEEVEEERRHREKDEEEKKHRVKDEKRQRHLDKERKAEKLSERNIDYLKPEDKALRKEKPQERQDRRERLQEPHRRLQKDQDGRGGTKRKMEEDSSIHASYGAQRKMPAVPWVREQLRVRLISKSFKGGKYHKEKMVVKSVVTAENCECVVEGGRVLREVNPAWLETVIPKHPPLVVMVVRGPYNGQKGRILQMHKEQEKASIQLLEDETTILKLHYDDICEYVHR